MEMIQEGQFWFVQLAMLNTREKLEGLAIRTTGQYYGRLARILYYNFFNFCIQREVYFMRV